LYPPTQGREQLLLETGDRPYAAAECDLAGHGEVAAHRDAGHHRDNRRDHGDAGRGSILRRRAVRHVHVDVALVEQGRLDAEGDPTRAPVRRRRRDRFLHYVTQIARDCHLALAGHHDGFDGEQLATDVGPGEPGDDADQVLVLDLAVAVLRHAE